MANDQIKKADNGTYYFRANLGFDHSTGKRIQKYRSGFKTKKEAKEEYAKLVLQFASQSLPTEQKRISFGTFIEDTYLPWYQTQVKESTFENRAGTVRKHFSCFYEKFTDAIEPIDIQNWRLALIRAGYSPNYVRVTQGNALRCLRPCRHIGHYGKEPVTDGRQRSWAETACGLLDA